MRLLYWDCAGCGQIFRSFSFNSPHYSPHTIEESDSNQHNLVTIAYLGQAPEIVASPEIVGQAITSKPSGKLSFL